MLRFLIFNFSCSFLLLFPLFLHSQKDSSKTYLIQFDVDDLHLGKPNYKPNEDTLLENIQNQLDRNLLGNIGLPSYNLNPVKVNYADVNLGVRLKPLYYQNLLSPSGKIFQETKNIYTEIFASAGMKKEQVLLLSHSQKINNRNNISLFFNRYSSEGFYQHQLSFVNDLLISAHGNDLKNNSGYLTYFSFQKIKHEENGGIENDSTLQSNLSTRKDLLTVNLQEAKRLNKTFSVSVQPWIRLFRHDSLKKTNNFIYFKSEFEKTTSQYQDSPDQYFYDFIFKDSLNTNDSISLLKLKNELDYRFDFFNKKFNLFFGFQHEYSEFFNAENKFFQNNFLAVHNLYFTNNARNLFFTEKAQVVLNGYSKGDYLVQLKAEKKVDLFVFGLESLIENRTPDLFYQNFSGNNFSWKNNLKKSEAINAKAYFYSVKWKSGLNFYSRTSRNEVFFNENSFPFQYQEYINWTKVELNNKLKIGKFHFNNLVSYNWVSNIDLILQPDWILSHAVYFDDYFYKGNLNIQLGFQVNYWSGFFPHEYNPSLNLFTLQNTIENPGYAFADFFINFKIKPVSMFVKFDHINQGFSGTTYFLTPHYFQNDRMIRFGLKWIFTD